MSKKIKDAGDRWWTKAWNPITGCTNISCPVRKDCWAKGMCNRFDKLHGDLDFGKMMFHDGRIDDPSHWKTKQKIFTGNLGDMWQPDVQPDWIRTILTQIRYTNSQSIPEKKHVFQFLTKNPVRYIEYIRGCIGIDKGALSFYFPEKCWLGFTDINNSIDIDTIRQLRETFPNHVLFVSYEPYTKWRQEIVDLVDWVIVGGWSGDKKGDKYNGIAHFNMTTLISNCIIAKKPVFVKSNLKQYLPESFYIQQFPEVK